MDLISLHKELFWDTSNSAINSLKSKRLIIERVFNFGSLDEFRTILQFYGMEIIKSEIVEAGWLDPKTLHFASTFLKIPKSKFRCYKRRQSHPVYWD